VLTYATIAAGSAAGGRALAEYLLQTLPAERADLAQYYQRGMRPDLAGTLGDDIFAVEAASLVKLGATLDELPEALAATVQRRHAAFVDEYLAGGHRDVPEAEAFARLAEHVVSADDPAAEGERVLAQLRDEGEAAIFAIEAKQRQAETWAPPSNPEDAQDWHRDLAHFRQEWAGELARLQGEDDRLVGAYQDAERAADYRLAKVLEAVERGLYGHSTAEPRRDMHPRLAALLGLDPHRAPTAEEIGHVLAGRRADGEEIAGRQRQRATVSLADALGLDPARAPTWDEVGQILDGRRADGKAIQGPGTDTARHRFLALLGVTAAEPDQDQARHLSAGRMADGSEVDRDAYVRGVEASKARISAADFTFSADKSLSVAWALAPTEAERNILAQAHKDAVASTLGFIAAEMGHARKGKAGRGGTEPGEMAWLTFDHYAARPVVPVARTDAQGAAYTELLSFGAVGDPALHSHALVPSAVLTASGRVGALDLDTMAGRTKEWGALYQAFVATNLRRSGISAELDERTGAARLTAVPAHVRDAFSKRTADGAQAARDYAAAQGKDWDALTPEQRVGLIHASTQARRRSKESSTSAQEDRLADFVAWEGQAERLGYAHRSVLRPDEIAPARSRDERLEHAYQAALPLLEKAFATEAKLGGQALREIAARGLVASGVEDAAEISAITRAFATRGVRQDGQETALVWGDDAPVRGKARIGVTTALHENQERELVALAAAASRDRSAALPVRAVAAAVRRSGLSFEGEHGQAQRAAIDALGTGGRLGVFIGAAGAGKSAILRPLVDAWREDGRKVFGCSLGWNQTEALADAGIGAGERAAIDPFLKRAKAGKLAGLDRNAVVVIEEVGRVGTRQLLELLRLQAETGCKVVAIGDPQQCGSVEAGAVIALLRRALGEGAIPEIATTLRQRTEAERETTGLFREGRAAEAIERKRADGSALLVAGDYRAAVERVAVLWRERVGANAGDARFTISVSAPSNADARAVSLAIREQRRAMGQLGPDLVTVDATSRSRHASAGGEEFEMRLGIGDRVRLYERATASFATPDGRRTHGNIGSNGSVLDVREIGEAGLVLRNEAGREGLVRWDTLRDGESGRVRLGYGDVLTIDAAQGSTVGTHILAMPGGSAAVNGYKGYTAGSRHRDETVFVIGDAAERREITRRRPRGDFRPIREGDVWENVARNLSRQPEKSSALAFIEQAATVRRGTVRGFQAALQPMEQRRHEGRAATTAHARTRDVAAREQAALASRPGRLAAIRPAVRDAVVRGMEKVRPAMERAVEAVQRLRDAHRPAQHEEHVPRQGRGPRRRM